MIELVKVLDSFHDCLRAAIREAATLKIQEKQFYLELGIDQGNWSRMITGKANFPPELIPKFCQIAQNNLLIHWLAYQRGFELRIIPKELEERLSEKEAQLEEKDREITYLKSLISVKKEEVKE